MAIDKLRIDAPGFLSGLVFFTVVSLGSAYIVLSKLYAFSAVYVTLVPVAIMLFYALLLGLTRLFRLRDDQSGDNLYYMGFLFTLTSLAVSLYQFSEIGSAEQIVQNFGIAIASTIAGIALRIFFNQMRRDPVEVEHTARLELAQAARKVKRELESTVLEFAYFRRATQQSISDSQDEVVGALRAAKEKFVAELEQFALASSKPLADASVKSKEAIDQLNEKIAKTLEVVGAQIADGTTQLSKSSMILARAANDIASKLEALKAPDNIIEIKLSPMVQGLSRAVNVFSKNTEAQTKAVDSSTTQMEALSHSIATLITSIQALHSPSNVPPNANGKVVCEPTPHRNGGGDPRGIDLTPPQ